MSSPVELIADAVCSIRLHNSCIGRGFWWTLDRSCGQWTSCPSNPGTSYGYNCNGYGNCCLGCTGIRDSDYAKHATGVPSTAANFVCTNCGGGGGPCGKEVHCENAPGAEAIWDLAARDLQVAPFNLDRQTAFQVAERVLYIGSGLVTNWYACSCPNSDGCAATSAYQQFITADDDDGNLNNGTPHMTAIYNSHNRHAIACATPTPQNSGCSSGPTQAPVLTATAQVNGAVLNWTAVPHTSTYWIFKSIGIMGCDHAKIKIAQVPSTQLTYTDLSLDCKETNYMVQPMGSNAACLGPTSNCAKISPPLSPPSNVTATPTAPNQVTVSWNPVTGATGYNVYRKYVICGQETDEKIA